jgi:hypothetical protein
MNLLAVDQGASATKALDRRAAGVCERLAGRAGWLQELIRFVLRTGELRGRARPAGWTGSGWAGRRRAGRGDRPDGVDHQLGHLAQRLPLGGVLGPAGGDDQHAMAVARRAGLAHRAVVGPGDRELVDLVGQQPGPPDVGPAVGSPPAAERAVAVGSAHRHRHQVRTSVSWASSSASPWSPVSSRPSQHSRSYWAAKNPRNSRSSTANDLSPAVCPQPT